MSSPMGAAEARAPFGSYLPSPVQSAVIAAGMRQPANTFGRRMASFIRSFLKRWSAQPIDAVRLGSRMRLHPKGNSCEARLLVSPQFFDPAELALLESVLSPRFVFIDIGANVGTYTLFVATRTGRSARLIAVEPHPRARERLACNLALNGIDWVKVIPEAVSDQPGTARLYLNDRNIGSSSLRRDWEEDITTDSIDVPARTLLDLVTQEGLTHIDCIKADVEGFEDHVFLPYFRDAPAALRPSMLIIEGGREERSELMQCLHRNGYELRLATRNNVVLQRA
ncbi:MAG TPA: FkbM family methyltransferase [Hyphomicrobiaceae bacterium]|nr:FkbM family methyltransferase [Hyphomicrobiaceae bacterium]